jgi:uncharacterized oxidoreductase
MPTFTVERLHRFSSAVLMKAGAPQGIADRVATGLVLSNLKGVDSHGVIRLIQYVVFVDEGMIVPAAEPEVLNETPTTAVIDAHQGFGHVAAEFAAKIAIRKAKESGVSTVTLRHTRHIGRLGEYVEMAIEAGQVGMAVCSAGPFVAPHGGARRALGTNPIAIGLPSDMESPYVMDFATAVYSEGKVRVYRELGKTLPEGIIIGPEGQPSTNPEALYAGGSLLPIGAYKGYALSLTIELLGALLAGGGTALIHPLTQGTSTFGNGSVFIMLDLARFCDPREFRADVAASCTAIKQTPLREGFQEILVPGEPEYRAEKTRRASGIPIPDPVWDSLRKLAEELGVEKELLKAG